MKKRLAPFLLCLALTVTLLPLAALADNGPKPSVRVTFQNMGEELCYGTLLSQKSSTGPAWAWSGKEGGIRDDSEGGHPIWEAFQTYDDPDGFFFLQWWWPCSGERPLEWSYYPPDTFKVLLYFPGTDTYRVSGVYERYAFHSYFAVDMSQSGPLVLEREGDYAGEGLSLLARLTVTLCVELAVALLFGLKGGRLLLTVAGVNGATQALLNAALNWAGYRMGGVELMRVYLLLEAGIFGTEGLCYWVQFPRLGGEEAKKRAWPYALAANLCSFLGGFLLARVMPFLS